MIAVISQASDDDDVTCVPRTDSCSTNALTDFHVRRIQRLHVAFDSRAAPKHYRQPRPFQLHVHLQHQGVWSCSWPWWEGQWRGFSWGVRLRASYVSLFSLPCRPCFVMLQSYWAILSFVSRVSVQRSNISQTVDKVMRSGFLIFGASIIHSRHAR